MLTNVYIECIHMYNLNKQKKELRDAYYYAPYPPKQLLGKQE